MSAPAPARYTKRPVTIEAVQFDGTPESAAAIMKWVDSAGGTSRYSGESLTIVTLEGDMKAAPGWWVIRGLAGEHYPCDPDVFAKSYEPAEETK